ALATFASLRPGLHISPVGSGPPFATARARCQKIFPSERRQKQRRPRFRCGPIAAKPCFGKHSSIMSSTSATPLTSGTAGRLSGICRVPGDKSLSHRALILGGLAIGRTRVTGLLEGEDVLCTAGAMRALGAGVTRQADGAWLVSGVGVGGLQEP